VPSRKRYLDGSKGVELQDLWTDIEMPRVVTRRARQGYPTEKPLALLERIVELTSSEGDIALDPFWRCATALVVAQKLGRRWVGIDVTYLAIRVMRARLERECG